MIETIHSIKDQRITLARELKSLRGRQEQHRILLEGEEILDWAIENAVHVEYILVSEKSILTIALKYQSLSLPVYAVS